MLRTQKKYKFEYIGAFQESKREGGSRVGRRELTAAASPERTVTRIQPRGNTTVAVRYVSVIIYIQGRYINLQHDATVDTSSYTRDVLFEGDNEIFNTRKLYNIDLYVSNSMMHRKFVQ